MCDESRGRYLRERYLREREIERERDSGLTGRYWGRTESLNLVNVC